MWGATERQRQKCILKQKKWFITISHTVTYKCSSKEVIITFIDSVKCKGNVFSSLLFVGTQNLHWHILLLMFQGPVNLIWIWDLQDSHQPNLLRVTFCVHLKLCCMQTTLRVRVLVFNSNCQFKPTANMFPTLKTIPTKPKWRPGQKLGKEKSHPGQH